MKEQLPEIPCQIPEHGRLSIIVFTGHPEEDARAQTLLDALKACPQCKDKQRIIIRHQIYTAEGLEQAKHPQPIDFTYSMEPEPEPLPVRVVAADYDDDLDDRISRIIGSY